MSLFNAPISTSSVSAFIELVELANEPLSEENREKINLAEGMISSIEDRKNISIELATNQPSSIKTGTVGQYIFDGKFDFKKEEEATASSTSSEELDDSSYPEYYKSKEGLLVKSNKLIGSIATVKTSNRHHLSESDQKILSRDGIVSVNLVSSNGSVKKLKLNSLAISSSSESIEEGKDCGSASQDSFIPDESRTRSASSSKSNSSISSFPSSSRSSSSSKNTPRSKDDNKKKMYRKDEKNASNFNWVALILIVIAIILVVVGLIFALRRYWSGNTAITSSSPTTVTQAPMIECSSNTTYVDATYVDTTYVDNYQQMPQYRTMEPAIVVSNQFTPVISDDLW